MPVPCSLETLGSIPACFDLIFRTRHWSVGPTKFSLPIVFRSVTPGVSSEEACAPGWGRNAPGSTVPESNRAFHAGRIRECALTADVCAINQTRFAIY